MNGHLAEEDGLRRALLGWGVAAEPIAPGLELGRDLRLQKGDLVTVEGTANLVQVLELAFTTLRGASVFDVEFGFDGLNALTEESTPLMVRERVRVAVVNVLAREPRIRRIVDVQVLDDRLTRVTAGRTLQVRVAFETITGDRQTVGLSQGGT
ncbi:hypothetical protein ACWDA3_56030 [Nonomuraea rubra]